MRFLGLDEFLTHETLKSLQYMRDECIKRLAGLLWPYIITEIWPWRLSTLWEKAGALPVVWNFRTTLLCL